MPVYISKPIFPTIGGGKDIIVQNHNCRLYFQGKAIRRRAKGIIASHRILHFNAINLIAKAKLESKQKDSKKLKNSHL